MKIVKIILFPLWPVFIAWRISKGWSFSFSTFSGSSRENHSVGGFFGHFIWTVILSCILYYLIFAGLRNFGVLGPRNSQTPSEIAPQEQRQDVSDGQKPMETNNVPNASTSVEE